MGYYIQQLDIELRLTPLVLAQATDSNRLRTADLAVVNRLIEDAESYVEAGIQATYKEEGIQVLRAMGAKAPHSVIRLCVDAAEYMLFARHPDYIRGDWVKRRELLDDQLAAFRHTSLRLEPVDDGPAQLPIARGEEFVDSGNTDDPTCDDHIFLNGTGIF